MLRGRKPKPTSVAAPDTKKADVAQAMTDLVRILENELEETRNAYQAILRDQDRLIRGLQHKVVRLNGSVPAAGEDPEALTHSVSVLADAGYDALMLELAESRRAISFPATTSQDLEEELPFTIRQDHFSSSETSPLVTVTGMEGVVEDGSGLQAGMAAAAAAAVAAAAEAESPASAPCSGGGGGSSSLQSNGLAQPPSSGIVARQRLASLAGGMISSKVSETGTLETGISRLASLAALSGTDSCSMAFPDFNMLGPAPVVSLAVVLSVAECGTQTDGRRISTSGHSAAGEEEDSHAMGRARAWSNNSESLGQPCSSAQEAMLQAAAAQAARQALALSTGQVTALQSQLLDLQQLFQDLQEHVDELTNEREMLEIRLSDMQENSKAIVETLQKRYITVVAEKLACEKRVGQLQMGMSMLEGERDSALASAAAGAAAAVAAAAAAAAQAAIAACVAAPAAVASLPLPPLILSDAVAAALPVQQQKPVVISLQDRALTNASMIAAAGAMQVGGPAVRTGMHLSISSYGSGDFGDGGISLVPRSTANSTSDHRQSSTLNMPFQFPVNHTTQGHHVLQESRVPEGGSSSLSKPTPATASRLTLDTELATGLVGLSAAHNHQNDPPTPSALPRGLRVALGVNIPPNVSLPSNNSNEHPQTSSPRSPRRDPARPFAPHEHHDSRGSPFSSPSRGGGTVPDPVSAPPRVDIQRSSTGTHRLGSADRNGTSVSTSQFVEAVPTPQLAREISAVSEYVEEQYSLEQGGALAVSGALAAESGVATGQVLRTQSHGTVPYTTKMDLKAQKGTAATKGSSLKKLFNKFNPLTHGGAHTDAAASGRAGSPPLGHSSLRRVTITELPVSKSSRIDPNSVSFQEEYASNTLHGPLPGVKSNDHAPKIMARFLSDLDNADCSPSQFEEPPPDLQWNSMGRDRDNNSGPAETAATSRSVMEGLSLVRDMSDELSQLKPNSEDSSDGSSKEGGSEHRSVGSV